MQTKRSGQTIDEIRHIIKDIYEQKHGLGVNVVMKQNTSLFSISNKSKFFVVRGVLRGVTGPSGTKNPKRDK